MQDKHKRQLKIKEILRSMQHRKLMRIKITRRLGVSLDCNEIQVHLHFKHVDLVYYSQNPLVRISINFSLKLGPTARFTHLKIILLQYFQFLVISNIQTDHKSRSLKVTTKVQCH